MEPKASAGAVSPGAGGSRCAGTDRQRPQSRLQWIKSFETGSAEIDALHRQLVEQCDGLLLALDSAAPWSRILADAGRLVEGCIQHFRLEEDLLAWSRFPRKAGHVAEHRRFERELHGLIWQMRAADGSREEHRAVPRELGPMLVEFIIRHDLDYRSHLMHVLGR